MTIKIHGWVRKFYEFHISSCMFEPIFNQRSWIWTFDSYIVGKPMRISLWCCFWIALLSRKRYVMTIVIQGWERRFYEFYISSCMFEINCNKSSWVGTIGSYIVGKPIKSSFWCCYWLASLYRSSYVRTIKIQKTRRENFMNFIFPAVCLNQFLTKDLEFEPLTLISLESPWELVCDAAFGLHC